MQDLTQMSNEQLWELFPIVLEPHNPAWKMWYEQEAEQVCRAVGRQNVLRLSHIGSTSVPGLLAKPTVDILLEISEETALEEMLAGLEHAKGDLVAVMDADLQDPPELLPQLLAAAESGQWDCAAVRRVDGKGEPPIRSWFARQFYKLINKMSRTEIVDGARDYRLMTRQMADAVLRVTEYNRFSKGIFSWVGFRTKWVETENVSRAAGESKWSFFKLLLYALDGIIAFSTAPLAIASVLGLALCAVSFFAIIFVVVRQLVWGGSAFGWPSLVCIILFLAGVQLFCIGILGQYLAKTYLEVKKRPIYILREQGGDHGQG